MTTQRFSDTAQWASLYASGALDRVERDAFEAELRRGNTELQTALASFQDSTRHLVEDVPRIAPSPRSREAVLAFAREHADRRTSSQWSEWADDALGQEDDLYLLKAEDGDWEDTSVPGVTVRRLFVDHANNRMTAMFRMAPGSSYVPHVHDGYEECFVLEGDLKVGDLVMSPGDYQRADEGSTHGVQSTEGGCLLLISSSMSDKLV